MRHEAARTGCHGNLARFQSDQVSRKKLSLQTAVTNLSRLVQHEIPCFLCCFLERRWGSYYLCILTSQHFLFFCQLIHLPTFSWMVCVYYDMHAFIIAYDTVSDWCPISVSLLTITRGEEGHIVTWGSVRWVYMNHKHTYTSIQVFIRLAPRSWHESCIIYLLLLCFVAQMHFVSDHWWISAFPFSSISRDYNKG